MQLTHGAGSRLLQPLGLTYGAVAALRRRWYASHPDRARRLQRPVISIGNLSVGGSGKTPVVALVATLLRDAGERPAVLSRGYARARPVEGVVVVRDQERVRAGLDVAGDEPFMLAHSLAGVAVVVSPDRHLAGALAEARLGCTVHVLDDGFQHLELWRDIDVLIASRDDLQNGRVMPAGRLRERPAAARHADALILTDVDVEAAAGLGRAVGCPTTFVTRRSLGPPTGPLGEALALDRSQPVVAIAGIARPERFFDDLVRDGWKVVETVALRDHHVFTAHDVARIADLAKEHRAVAALVTEKDIVRWPSRATMPVPVAWMPLAVSVDPADAFRSWLVARLAEARTDSGVGTG